MHTGEGAHSPPRGRGAFPSTSESMGKPSRSDEVSLSITRPIFVTAFVDWNAQVHNARTHNLTPMEQAKHTLYRTAKSIGRALASNDPTARFSVAIRLYHGWHKGWQPTDSLRAIMATSSPEELAALSQSNIRFSERIDYGHTLLSALPKRRHISTIHLPNTLRQQSRHASREEKMVDTALAADLLHWARLEPNEWAIVLAEDDDLVPPVFTAESWIAPHGGRILIVRKRPCNAYLKTDGLLELIK